MLDALISGRALAAGELARAAGVSAATASEHLARMHDGGLVTVTKTGRHRYFQLASPDVARAVEALALISPSRPASSLRQAGADAAMQVARTCYDHLAGRLGVELYQSMVTRRAFDVTADGLDLTLAGEAWLTTLGIDLPAARAMRRQFARQCLDFTERMPHVAGSIGAALCTNMFDLGWVVRRTPAGRALRITDEGARGLADIFDIDLRPS